MIGLLLMLADAPLQAPCFVDAVENGVRISRYVGDRACVAFKPPRLYHGIFVDAFEGQAFHEGAATLADLAGRKGEVWFSTDATTRFTVPLPRGSRGHAYRVTFRGREARDMGRMPLEGYGHLGMSAGLVLVDEVIAATDLGSPPR